MKHCPICSLPLYPVERAVLTTVPSTVPEYVNPGPYRRTYRWTLVRCKKGHTLKQVDDGLYGVGSYP